MSRSSLSHTPAGELWRRLAYLVRRHLLRADFLVARDRTLGLRFRFKAEDAVGRRIFQTGVYEPPLTRFLLEHLELRPGDVLVDAGANLGWFSVLLSRRAPDGATIYAFEPDPLNFELLAENVERNAADRVVPVRKALDAREGRRALHLYPDKNRGRHSFAEPAGAEGAVEVEATTLAGFWEERGLGGRRLGLLKADVEGFELSVLEGAAPLLEGTGVVVTEIAPELLRRAGADPSALVRLLTGRGFRPHRLTDSGRPEPVAAGTLAGVVEPENFVWMREGEHRIPEV